jgi:hypothetical protein
MQSTDKVGREDHDKMGKGVSLFAHKNPINHCGYSRFYPDAAAQDRAMKQTVKDVEEHPCGCTACFANILLANLRAAKTGKL